jgi:hypothetical protein
MARLAMYAERTNTADYLDSPFVQVDSWMAEVNSLNEKMKRCEINLYYVYWAVCFPMSKFNFCFFNLIFT